MSNKDLSEKINFQTNKEKMKMPERVITDQEALDQIADALGLYTTDPSNNPIVDVVGTIVAYVQETGRATDVPEGA